MKFGAAIDLFIADLRSQGRINSDATERAYRATLELHADDVSNRDPRATGRTDVKTTLRRWAHPNTQGTRRAHLVSFYDWAMAEGIRKDNPARQTQRPRRRPAAVYRMTHAEVAAFLRSAHDTRERRLAFLGVCAGLRRQELRGVQGRHFRRDGFVWVSPDIGKGGRERWVPIISDLAEIVEEIRASVADDEYVLCAQRWRDPGRNRVRSDFARVPCSFQAIYYAVGRVAKRAGIAAHIHPHSMRHAFGDHIARFAGLRNAQELMGHASVDTTADTYTGRPTLDELALAIGHFTFLGNAYPLAAGAVSPVKAPTGSVPVHSASRTDAEDSADGPHMGPDIERLLAPLAGSVLLYAHHFAAVGR